MPPKRHFFSNKYHSSLRSVTLIWKCLTPRFTNTHTYTHIVSWVHNIANCGELQSSNIYQSSYLVYPKIFANALLYIAIFYPNLTFLKSS